MLGIVLYCVYLYRAGKKHQQAMKVAQQKAVARKKYKVPEGLPMPSYMASIDETFDTIADPSNSEDISNPSAEKWNTSNFVNIHICETPSSWHLTCLIILKRYNEGWVQVWLVWSTRVITPGSYVQYILLIMIGPWLYTLVWQNYGQSQPK